MQASPSPQRPNLITKRPRAAGILLTKRPRKKSVNVPTANTAKSQEFTRLATVRNAAPGAAVMLFFAG
jgi:hypothetical protein